MLIALLRQEDAGARQKLMLAVLLSGAANASVIAIINRVIQTKEVTDFHSLVMLVLCCALYGLSLRTAVRTLSEAVETLLFKLRTRLLAGLRQAELQTLDRLSTAEIFDRVTGQTTLISNSTGMLVLALHASVMLVFTSLYVAALSGHAFSVLLAVYGIGGYLYYLRREQARALMRLASAEQLGLFTLLADLLTGAKEVRLNTRRGAELAADIEVMAATLHTAPVQISVLNQGNQVFSRLMLFTLLATVVFLLPQWLLDQSLPLDALMAAILFMFSPLGVILRVLPEYERADLAVASLCELEQRLARTNAIAPRPAAAGACGDPWRKQFVDLRAEDLEFTHPGPAEEQNFTIGPLSLRIDAGEIVFFAGGNGSGKTTLLKLLTTLYTPNAGTLFVNGVSIGKDNAQAYREMIAAVFSDFHLFRKLYGLSHVAPQEINRHLLQMQLASQVKWTGNCFKNLDLSTGQRKRLAMAVALLEDRPIYVFDEWAADQDPEFRRYYYQELLPALKRQGKTILAISHDDRYFHCADRVVTLEYGKIRSVSSNVS